jgi:hypothetical protein
MTPLPIPSFARVEIRIAGTRDLLVAGEELRKLAGELERIARSLQPDDTSMILAHHKIRSTSKKLRGLSNAD